MEKFTIHPLTHESARGMLAALSGFHAELLESAEGCEIVVTLGRDGQDDGEIVAVLNALLQYVNERGGRPPQMELGGRAYLIGAGEFS
jgi:streptomycin 6-kinase